MPKCLQNKSRQTLLVFIFLIVLSEREKLAFLPFCCKKVLFLFGGVGNKD